MQVVLYNNQSDANYMSKTLHQIATIDCNIKDITDVINPTLYVNGQMPNNFNYFYISDLKRYYYKTDFNMDLKNTSEFTGHVDVLMSYASEIKAMRGVCGRSQSNFNKYLNDDMYTCLNYNRYQLKNIGSIKGTGSGVYDVMLIMGDVGTE